MAGNSNQLVVMNGTYLMKSRYKIPALVTNYGSTVFAIFEENFHTPRLLSF